MDGIKRVGGGTHGSSQDHQRLQKSMTLSRRFVKKPLVKANIDQTQNKKTNIEVKTHSAVVVKAQAKTERESLINRTRQGVKIQPSLEARQALERMRAKQVLKEQQRCQMEALRAEQQKQKVKAEEAKYKLAEAKLDAQLKKQQAKRKEKQEAWVRTQLLAAQEAHQKASPLARLARARLAARKAPAPKELSAKELKDKAIKNALAKMAAMDKADEKERNAKEKIRFWQKKRVAVLASLALVTVAILGYFVYLNLPHISARVMAMRVGISKSYPSYVPAGFRLDGLAQEEEGKLKIKFTKDDGSSFTLEESKSSWDSEAVLNNFVTKKWQDNYNVTKGQGLTIYTANGDAVWVNGGIFYQIKSKNLSMADLHDIAVSL